MVVCWKQLWLVITGSTAVSSLDQISAIVDYHLTDLADGLTVYTQPGLSSSVKNEKFKAFLSKLSSTIGISESCCANLLPFFLDANPTLEGIITELLSTEAASNMVEMFDEFYKKERLYYLFTLERLLHASTGGEVKVSPIIDSQTVQKLIMAGLPDKLSESVQTCVSALRSSQRDIRAQHSLIELVQLLGILLSVKRLLSGSTPSIIKATQTVLLDLPKILSRRGDCPPAGIGNQISSIAALLAFLIMENDGRQNDCSKVRLDFLTGLLLQLQGRTPSEPHMVLLRVCAHVTSVATELPEVVQKLDVLEEEVEIALHYLTCIVQLQFPAFDKPLNSTVRETVALCLFAILDNTSRELPGLHAISISLLEFLAQDGELMRVILSKNPRGFLYLLSFYLERFPCNFDLLLKLFRCFMHKGDEHMVVSLLEGCSDTFSMLLNDTSVESVDVTVTGDSLVAARDLYPYGQGVPCVIPAGTKGFIVDSNGNEIVTWSRAVNRLTVLHIEIAAAGTCGGDRGLVLFGDSAAFRRRAVIRLLANLTPDVLRLSTALQDFLKDIIVIITENCEQAVPDMDLMTHSILALSLFTSVDCIKTWEYFRDVPIFKSVSELGHVSESSAAILQPKTVSAILDILLVFIPHLLSSLTEGFMEEQEGISYLNDVVGFISVLSSFLLHQRHDPLLFSEEGFKLLRVLYILLSSSSSKQSLVSKYAKKIAGLVLSHQLRCSLWSVIMLGPGQLETVHIRYLCGLSLDGGRALAVAETAMKVLNSAMKLRICKMKSDGSKPEDHGRSLDEWVPHNSSPNVYQVLMDYMFNHSNPGLVESSSLLLGFLARESSDSLYVHLGERRVQLRTSVCAKLTSKMEAPNIRLGLLKLLNAISENQRSLFENLIQVSYDVSQKKYLVGVQSILTPVLKLISEVKPTDVLSNAALRLLCSVWFLQYKMGIQALRSSKAFWENIFSVWKKVDCLDPTGTAYTLYIASLDLYSSSSYSEADDVIMEINHLIKADIFVKVEKMVTDGVDNGLSVSTEHERSIGLWNRTSNWSRMSLLVDACTSFVIGLARAELSLLNPPSVISSTLASLLGVASVLAPRNLLKDISSAVLVLLKNKANFLTPEDAVKVQNLIVGVLRKCLSAEDRIQPLVTASALLGASSVLVSIHPCQDHGTAAALVDVTFAVLDVMLNPTPSLVIYLESRQTHLVLYALLSQLLIGGEMISGELCRRLISEGTFLDHYMELVSQLRLEGLQVRYMEELTLLLLLIKTPGIVNVCLEKGLSKLILLNFNLSSSVTFLDRGSATEVSQWLCQLDLILTIMASLAAEGSHLNVQLVSDFLVVNHGLLGQILDAVKGLTILGHVNCITLTVGLLSSLLRSMVVCGNKRVALTLYLPHVQSVLARIATMVHFPDELALHLQMDKHVPAFTSSVYSLFHCAFHCQNLLRDLLPTFPYTHSYSVGDNTFSFLLQLGFSQPSLVEESPLSFGTVLSLCNDAISQASAMPQTPLADISDARSVLLAVAECSVLLVVAQYQVILEQHRMDKERRAHLVREVLSELTSCLHASQRCFHRPSTSPEPTARRLVRAQTGQSAPGPVGPDSVFNWAQQQCQRLAARL